ncbi:hypothetical protein [Halosimplex pelagicum]|uniref:Uncharacterized protein n=1 Tax=Halosimplex pelagicum TaxID=869886 RepID=A0A7D5T7R6_9EURY|nr:hypothetical protein [Halosimplex pelagicum]QLH80470.1 hypothetical protein HZS54_01970 [Halosimplex pelagicum]
MTVRESTATTGAIEAITALSGAIRRSLSLKLALVGLGFVSLGYLLQTGVYAALLPIWGAGLLLVGTVSYALVWRTRQ